MKKALLDEWLVALLSIPAFVSIYLHRYYSKYFFAFFAFVITFKSLEGLFIDFNKVLMVVLFLYVCMSYAFYQLLGWKFSRAVFTPNFSAQILGSPMALRTMVELKSSEGNWTGYLTNWDAEGAFIYLDKPWPKANRKADLSLTIDGHLFEAKGTVIAATWDEMGIGVEWNQDIKTEALSWNSLIELFNDLGWEPTLLR
ncbi:MAG: hypothetical protein K2P81_12735 [Bacteriovoracaceae bacterium]|nr:hypothetical protein [Bacteriovoracaceae bacterium]